MSRIKKAKIEKYYSKIAIGFIIAVAIAAVAIVYFSFSKTVITVVPTAGEAKTTAAITIVPVGSELTADQLEGTIVEKTVSGTKAFRNLSSLRTVEEKATGIVTIYNKHSSAQPLVTTTRLLSEEGILFRTKETVTVPAGGEVAVNVEADQRGENGNIGPTRFTIVALWPGLQEKIYGESTTSMTGGTRDVMVATLENINEAKEQYAKELKEQAIQELSREIALKNPTNKIVPEAATHQITKEEADVEPGDEVDQFEVESAIKLTAFVFDENKMFELVKAKLNDSLNSSQELTGASKESLEYSVESHDPANQTAQLAVTLAGSTVIKLSSPIFNRDNLTNRDKQDIRTYFLDFPEIQSVEVKFSPFWVLRSPSLKDHIEIKIQK